VDVSKLEKLSSKVVIDKAGCLNVREKSEMAPSQTRAIDILLEITLKDRLSPKLFARMRMTYVLALKSLLVQVSLCSARLKVKEQISFRILKRTG
jgi:hypothetical protein